MKKSNRMKFKDVAFTYRMGAGFPGDINRTHPFSAAPTIVDASAPPTSYGQACLLDPTTQGVRPFAAGDQSNTLTFVPYGAVVRPFPLQQSSATNYGSIALGVGAPPTSGVVDVLQAGYIMVQLNLGVTAPVKGGAVYIWAAATSGSHIIGGYETAYSAGNTCLLDSRYYYTGGVDSSGVAEISFNV